MSVQPGSDGGAPKILSRTETVLSPWVRVVSKTVAGAAGRATAVYHCLAQPDYIAVLAVTPGGLIPIIRQYRPAVEADSWELPAGLGEEGEPPEATCVRELKEETGLEAVSVVKMGRYDADPGRMENRLHAFFVTTAAPTPQAAGEAGQAVEFVTPEALYEAALSGKIRYLHHVGVIAMALLQGLLPVSSGWVPRR